MGSSPLSGATLKLLYSLYGTPASKASTYATDFHDVTVGSNYTGSATTGYDKVTGLGSPVASAIVAAASTYGATTSASSSAVEVREVLVVRFLLQNHAAVNQTGDQANVSTVVVATVTIVVNASPAVDQTVAGALADSTSSVSVLAPAGSTKTPPTSRSTS